MKYTTNDRPRSLLLLLSMASSGVAHLDAEAADSTPGPAIQRRSKTDGVRRNGKGIGGEKNKPRPRNKKP